MRSSSRLSGNFFSCFTAANDLGILPLALFTLPEISTIACVKCNNFGMAGGPVPTTFSPTLEYLYAVQSPHLWPPFSFLLFPPVF
jgi:hypothetical protein